MVLGPRLYATAAGRHDFLGRLKLSSDAPARVPAPAPAAQRVRVPRRAAAVGRGCASSKEGVARQIVGFVG